MKSRSLSVFLAVILVTVMVGFTCLPQAEAAKKPIRWKGQTAWAPSITLWRGDKYVVDLMNRLAYGELEIDYNEGGTLVTNASEMFDAVRNNIIQFGTDWPSYWEGKNTAFSLITSVPMGFTPADYLLWFWQGGGLELAQDLYGKYGIVWFPHSVTSPESGQRSNVAIHTGAGYKDIKMRQCGRNQAKILQELGGAAIMMPGAEIYMALQRGTIDAGEFSVPECDWHMGFQEVTKYQVLPGWHQPGPVSGIMINKKAWDKLPERVKFLFKEACMSTMMWTWTYFEYSSADYTQKFLETGAELTRLDDETIDKIQELASNLLLADAEKNPDHAKIAFSQVRFFKKFAPWRAAQAPFMFGRTPANTDEVYAKLEAMVKKNGDYDSVIALEKSVRERMEGQKFWEVGTPYIQNPIAPK